MGNYRFETRSIHGGQDSKGGFGETRFPIYQTAAFSHETAEELEDVFNGRQYGFYYSRVANPSIAALEKRLNDLDEGIGSVVTASGMSAIATTIWSLAKTGENFVSANSIFGSTFYLFTSTVKDNGIEARFVDPSDFDSVEKSIDEKTRFIFVETVGNPKMNVADIQKLSDIATRHGIPLVVDNTFMTPYLFPVKDFGAHVVIHATTKYLCGGGSAIGGVVTDLGTFKFAKSKHETLKDGQKKFGGLAFVAQLRKVRSNTGVCQSPQNAFISSLGLDTLHLRMDRHCENAHKVASFFETHKSVESVVYPGLSSNPHFELAKSQFKDKFGGMIAIRLGSKEKAYKFVNNVKLAKNLVNLGDAKTLVVCPRYTIYRNFTDEQAADAGVYPDLVRISIGLENSDDIIDDFNQALGVL